MASLATASHATASALTASRKDRSLLLPIKPKRQGPLPAELQNLDIAECLQSGDLTKPRRKKHSIVGLQKQTKPAATASKVYKDSTRQRRESNPNLQRPLTLMHKQHTGGSQERHVGQKSALNQHQPKVEGQESQSMLPKISGNQNTIAQTSILPKRKTIKAKAEAVYMQTIPSKVPSSGFAKKSSITIQAKDHIRSSKAIHPYTQIKVREQPQADHGFKSGKKTEPFASQVGLTLPQGHNSDLKSSIKTYLTRRSSKQVPLKAPPFKQRNSSTDYGASVSTNTYQAGFVGQTEDYKYTDCYDYQPSKQQLPKITRHASDLLYKEAINHSMNGTSDQVNFHDQLHRTLDCHTKQTTVAPEPPLTPVKPTIKNYAERDARKKDLLSMYATVGDPSGSNFRRQRNDSPTALPGRIGRHNLPQVTPPLQSLKHKQISLKSSRITHKSPFASGFQTRKTLKLSGAQQLRQVVLEPVLGQPTAAPQVKNLNVAHSQDNILLFPKQGLQSSKSPIGRGGAQEISTVLENLIKMQEECQSVFTLDPASGEAGVRADLESEEDGSSFLQKGEDSWSLCDENGEGQPIGDIQAENKSEMPCGALDAGAKRQVNQQEFNRDNQSGLWTPKRKLKKDIKESLSGLRSSKKGLKKQVSIDRKKKGTKVQKRHSQGALAKVELSPRLIVVGNEREYSPLQLLLCPKVRDLSPGVLATSSQVYATQPTAASLSVSAQVQQHGNNVTTVKKNGSTFNGKSEASSFNKDVVFANGSLGILNRVNQTASQEDTSKPDSTKPLTRHRRKQVDSTYADSRQQPGSSHKKHSSSLGHQTSALAHHNSRQKGASCAPSVPDEKSTSLDMKNTSVVNASPYVKKPHFIPSFDHLITHQKQQESSLHLSTSGKKKGEPHHNKSVPGASRALKIANQTYGSGGGQSGAGFRRFERLAQQQVLAFVNSGRLENDLLRQHLTDMIFNNVKSMSDQDFDSRELAREKQILRDSLQNQSIAQLTKKVQQSSQASLKSSTAIGGPLPELDQEMTIKHSTIDSIVLKKDLSTKKQKSTIVLSIHSQDKWFKRAARAAGWVENVGHGSHLFNVKWDYSDSANQDVYKQLRSNQFYNHFPGSRELTTKQGLNQNLQNLTQPGVDIYDFYPRCYDLSDSRQVDLFQDEFNRTAILACLKKHAKYFKAHCREQMKEIEARDALILPNAFQAENKRQLKRHFIGKFPPKGSIAKLNSILLRNAIFFARNLLVQTSQECEGDEFIKRDYFEPTFRFNQRILNLVVRYSQLDLPIDPEALIGRGKYTHQNNLVAAAADEAQLGELLGRSNVRLKHLYADLFRFKGWEVPNLYVMYQAYKMHKELKANYPQYGPIDGSDNVWICKPSFTARGVGIFCFRSLRELFNGQTKKQMCPKIVQKYIERSFLLESKALPSITQPEATAATISQRGSLSPRANRIASLSPTKAHQATTIDGTSHQGTLIAAQQTEDLRKFDLRQWVYVNSFEPLSAFIYKKAYLRICGAHFDLSEFSDAQRHISNYSVQKDHELVLSCDDFISYLHRQDPAKYGTITWENYFLPQVDRIVKATLTQVCEVIENRINSFELYGFDFVVDKDLKLWLIEVNMSPACAERQPWLVDMLNDMATGLVAMIGAKVQASREANESELQSKTQAYGFFSQGQETAIKTKLCNKLQKTYLEQAIEGTQWQPMSKCDSFYIQGSGGKPLKIKIPQGLTQVNVNPGNLEKNHLEVVGTKADIRMERFMDQMCQRVAAIGFIQKFFRGHLVRSQINRERQVKLQRAKVLKKAARDIFENLELAFDRFQAIDPREESFSNLKDYSLHVLGSKLSEDPASLDKVVKIQMAVRQWLLRAQGDRALLPSQGVATETIEVGQNEAALTIMEPDETIVSSTDPHSQLLNQDQSDQVLLTGSRRRKVPIPFEEVGSADGPSRDMPASALIMMHERSHSQLRVGIEEPITSRQEVRQGFGLGGIGQPHETQTSINFQDDERVVQRASIASRGTRSVNSSTNASQGNFRRTMQNTFLPSQAINIQTGDGLNSRAQLTRADNATVPPALDSPTSQANLLTPIAGGHPPSTHDSRSLREIVEGHQRATADVAKINQDSTTRRMLQQLDSYLLLDYRAVGVDMIIPQVELQRGRRLQAIFGRTGPAKVVLPSQATAPYASGRSPSKPTLHSRSFANPHINNNYTFSPRHDCQQNGLVQGVLRIGARDKIGTSSGVKEDSQPIKRAAQAKKVKNQILAAYMDNKVRIKPPVKTTAT